MKRISGRLLFDRRRIVRSLQISITFLVITFLLFTWVFLSLLINDPFDPIFAMSDPLTIFLVFMLGTLTYNCVLYIILYCLNFYIFQKRISFNINETTGHLSIYRSGKLILNTQDYQFKTDYQWIGNNLFHIFHGSAFFHLEITEVGGNMHHFYERIDSKNMLSSLTIKSPHVMGMHFLRTPKRHPSFIHQVYEELSKLRGVNS